MSYESFYGGRQGASFIIVERFDGINIPDGTPKKAYYAANENGIRFYPFIVRTDQNFARYNWVETTLDGATVTVVLEGGQQAEQELPTEYQKGMVQCFKQGGDTTDIVNYGEYVIIDTISKDNPENGKVFRRGMNFDNELGGAEYIGQIIGPKGSTADLDMAPYAEVVSKEPHKKGEYTPSIDNQSLVPGANDAETEFNDSIKYVWAIVRDASGNIEYYQVGFQFPYLVQHFTAAVRSAYKSDGTPLDINDELIDRIDDKTHPFFSKWRINVPRGIKGESISTITTVPTKIKEQSSIYPRVNKTTGQLSGTPIIIKSSPSINLQTISETKGKNYAELEYNGTTWYVDIDDCCDVSFVRKNINYDSHAEGDVEFFEIGSYKVLKDVSVNTGLNGNQKIHVIYEGAKEGDLLEEDIGDPINYIIESAIVNKADYAPEDREGETDPFLVPWGSLLVYYSDPNMRTKPSHENPDPTHPEQDPGYIWHKNKNGEIVGGWVILGNTLRPGSIQSICNFTTYEQIRNRTPEEIGGDPSYSGWVVTVGDFNGDKEYYAYDYLNHVWYKVGKITVNTDPKLIVDIDSSASLQEDGIRFNSKIRKSIY